MTIHRIVLRTAVAVGALATVVVASLVVPSAAGAIPPAARSLTTTGVTRTAAAVTVGLDVTGVPAGTRITDSSVGLSADGHPLPTHLTNPAADTSAARRRSAVLVLDVSGSMAGARIAAARSAAVRYVDALPADIAVGVVAFADRPSVVVAPTADRAAVVRAIGGLRAAGNTALYDAVAAATSVLRGQAGTGEKRMLLLSDGQDTASRTTLASVRAYLTQSHVALDAVGIAVDHAQMTVLRGLAGTGGKAVSTTQTGQLTSAFVSAAATFAQHLVLRAEVPAALQGEDLHLTATVSFAGHRLSAVTDSAALSLPTVRATATTSAAAAPARVLGVPWWIPALAFVVVLAVAVTLLWRPRGARPLPERLQHIEAYLQHPEPAEAQAVTGPEHRAADVAVGLADRLLRSRASRQKMATGLEKAGLRIRPAEWVLIRLCVGVVAIAALGALSGSLLLGIVLGVLVGWLATAGYLRLRASRRAARFADQLPDLLQLVASSLRSGFSLDQALDAVSREATEPAAGEFSRALAEVRLGASLEDALDRVATRLDSPDLAWVVMAVRISRGVGGNLAEVIGTTVQTIRARVQVKRQVRALSAEGRLSGIVLVAMPILVAGFFAVTRPEYISPLWTQPAGWAMSVTGVLAMVIGTFWMSRVVKVEI